MARFYVIGCCDFGYKIIDSEELAEMKDDGEQPYIIGKFNNNEDARNFIDELEGKQMQGRCIGNEFI